MLIDCAKIKHVQTHLRPVGSAALPPYRQVSVRNANRRKKIVRPLRLEPDLPSNRICVAILARLALEVSNDSEGICGVPVVVSTLKRNRRAKRPRAFQ
jgi:hypothetical protein